MENVTERTVVAEGREIMYQLERKPVKNLNLRICKDGSVHVSANKFISPSEIDAFVVSKGTYVLRAIDKFHEMALYRPQPKRYISGETFYKLFSWFGSSFTLFLSLENLVSLLYTVTR